MIKAYTGNIGAGKTYSLVRDLMRLARRRPDVEIWTNFHTTFTEYYENIEEMLEIGKGGDFKERVVAIDECGIWFNSRMHKGVGLREIEWFAQLRHRDIHCYYTVQRFAGADSHIRGLTSIEYRHVRYGPYIIQNGFEPGEKKPFSRSFYRLNPKVYRAYDTREIVGDGRGKLRRAGGLEDDGAVVRLSDAARDLLEGAMCRDVYRQEVAGHVFERSVLRVATVDDFFMGREVVRIDRASGRLIEVDTAAFQIGDSVIKREVEENLKRVAV